jgi:hypothetical protein
MIKITGLLDKSVLKEGFSSRAVFLEEVQRILGIMKEMYKKGSFSNLKSGTNCMNEEMVSSMVIALNEKPYEGSFKVGAYNTGDIIYFGDGIKALCLMMELELGYKTKVSVSGDDKSAIRRNSGGRASWHGGSKERIISYKKI